MNWGGRERAHYALWLLYTAFKVLDVSLSIYRNYQLESISIFVVNLRLVNFSLNLLNTIHKRDNVAALIALVYSICSKRNKSKWQNYTTDNASDNRGN